MNTPTTRAQAQAGARLGVHPGAPPEVLRAAWRDAVRRAHPDRGGDTEHFIAVNAAYELLAAPGQSTTTTSATPGPATPPATNSSSAARPTAAPQRFLDLPALLRFATALLTTAALLAALSMIAAPVVTAATTVAALAGLAQHAHRTFTRRPHPEHPATTH